MEDPTIKALFGPLNRKYCVWFYWLSVIGFIYLMIALIGAILMVVQRKMDGKTLIQLIGGMSIYAIFYFQNRLLYTMCTGSA